jgi:hypothetical protein
VNPGATGTNQALIIYSARGTKTDVTYGEGDFSFTMSSCTGASAQIKSRVFVTVTPALAETKKALTTAPFGSTETDENSFAPGKTANTWIVVGYKPSTGLYGGMAPPSPAKGYVISAKGAVTAKKAIALTAVGDKIKAPGSIDNPFTSPVDSVRPIKELSNGNWLVYREQLITSFEQDGSSYALTIGRFNPVTGVLTNGEVLSISEYPLYGDNGQFILKVSTNNKTGLLSYYVLTEEGKYRAATWKTYAS